MIVHKQILGCGDRMEINIDYDDAKDSINLQKHGISLALAGLFEWDTAHVEEDTRRAYGEARFKATGYIGPRLHVLIFCPRDGLTRIISLRKANPREERRYAKT